MKRFVKRLFTDDQWRTLARLKTSILGLFRRPSPWVTLGQLVAKCVRILPLRTQAVLKESVNPVGFLDYQHKQVRMFVDSTMQFGRLRSCAKEPETVEWIDTHIRPGDVFYDVGANVGAYSLVACRHCAGQITVHAFEPSFSTYYQLCRNIILNGYQENIIPHMIALSKQSGTSVFNYQSIEAGASLHTLGANVDYKGDSFEPIYRQQVMSFSLDDLVSRYGFPVPNHIKLDVDGTELEILYGATETLSDARVGSILVEVCDLKGQSEAILEFLSSKGFRPASQINHGAGVLNYIFERKAYQ